MTPQLQLLRLAHVELAVDDLVAARDFYQGLLGFIVAFADTDHIYLRAPREFDLWSLKLTQHDGPGLIHAGFRAASPESLDDLERLHQGLGLSCQRLDGGWEYGQGPALRVVAHDGMPIEFFHEFAEVPIEQDGRVRLPWRVPGVNGGISPRRIDHVNLRGPDMTAALRYWTDALHFSISEYRVDGAGETDMAWTRCAAGSHDVAIGRADTPGMHHVAYVVDDQAALTRALDLLADAEMAGAIEFGPGRHGVTDALFAYIRDPAGNRLEIYCGDYQRDHDRAPIRWGTDEYERHGRLWWGQAPPRSFSDSSPIVPARAVAL